MALLGSDEHADADAAGEVLVAFRAVTKAFARPLAGGDAEDPDDLLDDQDDDEDRDTLGGVALAATDLEVPRGRIVGVVGPHGSGKTTLVRLAAGTLEPTAGEVVVRGSVAPPPEGLVRLMDPEQPGRYAARLLRALLGTARDLAADEVAAAYAHAGAAGREGESFGRLDRHTALAVVASLCIALEPDVMLLDGPLKIADEAVRNRLTALVAERVAAGACAIVTSGTSAGLPFAVDTLLDLGRRPGPALPAESPRPAAEPRTPGDREDLVIADELDAIRFHGVSVDLTATPPVLRVVVDVRVQRTDVYIGCVVHLPGRPKLKVRSPTFVFGAGRHEIYAHLGGVEGGAGDGALEIGLGVEDAARRLILMWPEWLEFPAGSGLDHGVADGLRPAWRVAEGRSLTRGRAPRGAPA